MDIEYIHTFIILTLSKHSGEFSFSAEACTRARATRCGRQRMLIWVLLVRGVCHRVWVFLPTVLLRRLALRAGRAWRARRIPMYQVDVARPSTSLARNAQTGQTSGHQCFHVRHVRHTPDGGLKMSGATCLAALAHRQKGIDRERHLSPFTSYAHLVPVSSCPSCCSRRRRRRRWKTQTQFRRRSATGFPSARHPFRDLRDERPTDRSRLRGRRVHRPVQVRQICRG